MEESSWDFIDIKNISLNLSTQDYFRLMWLTFSDFEWKNIASIWWWFWMLEMDLVETGNTMVEVIDPLFSDLDTINKNRNKTYWWIKDGYERQKEINPVKDILQKLYEEKKRVEEKISGLLDGNFDISELYELEDELNGINFEIEDKKNKQENIQKYIENKIKIILNLEKWNSMLNSCNEKQNFGKLKLNSSYWENIKWVEKWTKDYVFINHILYKFNEDPEKIEKFLEQADKILRDDWKIFIVDYMWDLPEFEKYFQKKWTYKKFSWEICGFLSKWEYKELFR